jgi:Phosphotransferase enzyme family
MFVQHWPAEASLERAITAVLEQHNPSDAPIRIMRREMNAALSSYGAEIVTCHLGTGEVVRLLCKHASRLYGGHEAHGARPGVAYEAEVYERVLQPSEFATPRYFGSYTDPVSGELWLIIEHLDNSVWVNESSDPDSMWKAAQWIGRFHRAHEAGILTKPGTFLIRHDEEYYGGWARRTRVFSATLHGRFRWLPDLCDRFESVIPELLAQPQTVVHGEYYANNAVYRDGIVYPVDWESAAVGLGHVDLATLTDGWPGESVRACASAYGDARWPDGLPPDYERTLTLAQLCVQFRWLGDRPEWTLDDDSLWRVMHLRRFADRLGLVQEEAEKPKSD